MLSVQWIGGPFDGAWERVEDEATTFAVAYTGEWQRVDIPGLQAVFIRRGQLPRHPAIRRIKTITVYTIDPQTKTILYRENPPL